MGCRRGFKRVKMQDKKGVLEGVIILVGLAIIALILISILIWGKTAIFYGGAIFLFLITLIISIKKPRLFASPLPYVLIFTAIFCAFMPTIFRAVGLEMFGIETAEDWHKIPEEASKGISCSDKQDCIDYLLGQGLSQEKIDENIKKIKCQEVCYIKP